MQAGGARAQFHLYEAPPVDVAEGCRLSRHLAAPHGAATAVHFALLGAATASAAASIPYAVRTGTAVTQMKKKDVRSYIRATATCKCRSYIHAMQMADPTFASSKIERHSAMQNRVLDDAKNKTHLQGIKPCTSSLRHRHADQTSC
jgi:hypothetical protein